jgi:hypothetical protein
MGTLPILISPKSVNVRQGLSLARPDETDSCHASETAFRRNCLRIAALGLRPAKYTPAWGIVCQAVQEVVWTVVCYIVVRVV